MRPSSRGDPEEGPNASLIKVNQIGTVTETLEAIRVSREAGYAQMVSHRSGETEDAFIAALVVGACYGQIKSGAPALGSRSTTGSSRSPRLALPCRTV
ncbi:hypothetical protein [Streptomyces sp. NPDC000888]